MRKDRVIYQLVAAAELGLSAIRYGFDVSFLPLGGGHLQQMGLVFVSAFIALEFAAGWHILWARNEREARRLQAA